MAVITVVSAGYNSEKNDRGEFQHKQYIIVVVEDLVYTIQHTFAYQYLSCKMVSKSLREKNVRPVDVSRNRIVSNTQVITHKHLAKDDEFKYLDCRSRLFDIHRTTT